MKLTIELDGLSTTRTVRLFPTVRPETWYRTVDLRRFHESSVAFLRHEVQKTAEETMRDLLYKYWKSY